MDETDQNTPEGQEASQPGKRLVPASGPSPVAKRIIILCCALVVALAAGYTALCAWVGSGDTILPRTTAAGVSLGGMTTQGAVAALTEDFAARYGATSVTLTYESDTYTVPGTLLGIDAEKAVAEAYAHGHEGTGFFARGIALLTSYETATDLIFTQPQAVDTILDQVVGQLDRPMTDTSWEIVGEELVFHMGTAGLDIAKASVTAQVLDLFRLQSGGSLALVPTVTAPTFPDLAAVRDEVCVGPADATLDPDTKDVVPARVGIEFSVDEVTPILEAAAEGATVSVPVTVTQPEVTTEALVATLFRDVLGEATSKVSGSGNRKSNVKLAAAACADQILIPGGVFAYNVTTGSRSSDKGYLPAPAYVGGLSSDEVGGGICQVSSTIYYAALNSNLKIVERKNHSYAVGYVPDGMDATVYYGSLDFRFENDTKYPLKIVTESYDKGGARYLTVKIMGTKTNTNYVVMTNKELSSAAPTTVYRADPGIPAGSTRPDPRSTAYRGRTVNSYRNIYAEDGTLISSTLEAVSKYSKRDRVILVNPAELESYQATGTAPAQPPVVTETPIITESPAVTGTPVETPAVTESPAMTTPPTETTPVTTTPVETPPPAETPPPSQPAATPPPDIGIPTL